MKGGLGAVYRVGLSTFFRDLQVHGREAGKFGFSKSNLGFAGEFGMRFKMSSKLGNF